MSISQPGSLRSDDVNVHITANDYFLDTCVQRSSIRSKFHLRTAALKEAESQKEGNK